LGKTYHKSSPTALLPLGLGLDPACPGETAGNLYQKLLGSAPTAAWLCSVLNSRPMRKSQSVAYSGQIFSLLGPDAGLKYG